MKRGVGNRELILPATGTSLNIHILYSQDLTGVGFDERELASTRILKTFLALRGLKISSTPTPARQSLIMLAKRDVL